MAESPPPVLTLAGSDCSSGAGIQADLKTITALGCYGLSAVTAVVSEVPGLVSKVRLMDAAFIIDQVRVLSGSFPVKAAKTGMLGGFEQVEAVASAWRQFGAGLPLVVDPVMVSTSGRRLLAEDAVEAVKTLLLPQSRLMTPNLAEAAVLWGRPVESRADMAACAAELAGRFGTAVVAKGGHLAGDAAADVLISESGERWFEGERIQGVSTHGTGCAYSAAIACWLARGSGLDEAVDQAKRFITAAIRGHFAWKNAEDGCTYALNHSAEIS